MIRVLHVMACADAGGISAVVLNYYRFIDRSRIHFDIALTVPTAGQNALALQELGAEIHYLPLKSHGISAFRQALAELLQTGNYDALHVHESETCYVALQVAKKLGISCRIAHSHTASPWEGMKGELRRLSGCMLNYHYASHVVGCGQLAGDRVFGKYNMRRPRALVLPNAIDTRKFAFDESLRREVRTELALEDKYVLGMVGRLCVEKNYPFALELMARLCRENPDCMLVIAGNGEEQETIEQKIGELGIGSHVKLLGRRSDVHRLYQAFDIFLLPSFTEGYPVAAVEALASGLPVLLSDAVTPELNGIEAVTYLPLEAPEKWLQAVFAENRPGDRIRRGEVIRDSELDIHRSVGKLEQIYFQDTLSRQ